jgi:aldehyde:ferredoxin oxidoreductase
MRVNMNTKEISVEDLANNKEYGGFGGRGLTSMIVSKEVPPTCHPLGEKNKLVIAPGLLSGTPAANSGRLSVGAKSPLTGGIKESNVGGNAAFKLGRLGIRGIVVEGQAEPGKLYCLIVNKDGATLHPADEYKGLKNYDLVEKLKEKYGGKVGTISIGPAGEMKMSSASVAVSDPKGRPTRHAGRGGMGAVMGSKGLKAVVIDDTGAEKIEYADFDAFKQAAAKLRKALQAHDVTKPGGGLATFGTNVLVNIINEAGAFPTRNFTDGRFEGAEKISGETMHDVIKERGGSTTHAGCTTCIIQCSNIYLDKDKNYVTSALEYETVWANGANCGIDDLDAIARMDRLCDDYGLDTMDTGCAIGVAMAAGVKKFGDAEGAIELIHEIGKGTPLGRILGNGTAVTGQVFGVEDVPVVKRQALAAYDPRAIKGQGVTYATTTMGADHTAGYAVATNIMKCGGYVDPLKPDGQLELSRNLQITTAALDSAGLCIFIAFAILDIPEGLEAIPEMLNARYGLNMTLDGVTKHGQEILKAERAFNTAAGFTNLDDRLPDFFKDKKLPPHDVVFDVPDEELDKLYNF